MTSDDERSVERAHDEVEGAGTAGLPQVVDFMQVFGPGGQVLQWLFNYIPAVADQRARQMIASVLRLIERDDEWLIEEMTRRPSIAHFLARASRGWATDDDEAFRRKRNGYRATVARGLIDDAAINHQLLQQDVIAELSPLDLRVLQIIEEQMAATHHPVAHGQNVVERLGGDIAAAQVTLGHLERLTIIQASGRSWDDVEGESETGIQMTLRFTVFGAGVMEDLHSDDP